MNKQDLINVASEKSGQTKKMTAEFIDAFVAVASEAMANGDDVKLVGFGTFSVVERAERSGRNPRSGETMTIPAKKAVKFKAGKELKEMVAKAE